ncbi:MAG: septum formation initiator family protein [Sediminibacterium sp.]|nr:septum formation initiator family protein [Sediminibacterium sp.]
MLLLRIIKNKYFLTTIAILVWVLFFDKNDLFTQRDMVQKLRKLQKEKEYYASEIENNKRELNELQTNKKSLEKFAREKYLMKKDNEDVFVFVAR